MILSCGPFTERAKLPGLLLLFRTINEPSGCWERISIASSLEGEWPWREKTEREGEKEKVGENEGVSERENAIK